ncbi:MAG: insulinase family protein, partial [Phycisphaerae bacterium]|nr:insulinase family protein [Phycisphaerae bacterium]
QTIRLVHKDLYALDVLSYILTHGPASMLVQTVQREKKLVTSIDSYSWTPAWGKGEFAFTFRSAPEKADAAEKAILDQLKSVMARGVTAQQLKRAKRQKVADYVYSQQAAEDIADTLATDYLSTADATFSRNYTDRIQQVTLEQVQEVAKRYFTFDRMAITRMVPAGKQPATAAATQVATAKAETHFFRLPGGLRVILHPSDAVALVSMAFVTEGGLLCEDENTNGLGSLMTALSVKGAGKRSAEDIAKFFDSAGGTVTGSCGNNTFYWQATVLDDSFGEALEILADIIQKPAFSEKELEILRPQMISRVKKVDENWRSQLHKFFRSKFYRGHYRMLAVGDETVLKSATTKQVRRHHKEYVRDAGRSSVLAVYGKFDPAEARKRIEKLFVLGKALWLRSRALGEHQEDKLFILKTTNKVAGIILAVRGMKIRDEDRYPVTILDTIISGYHLPSGWLHGELRGKELVYVVHAYNWAGLQPGAFMAEAACQPEKVPEVVRIIEKNLQKAATYKPAQQEIDRAVNAILTAELLENQSMPALSMSAALDELYGFGYDFRRKLEQRYRKVTPEDVQRVAAKYLTRPHVVVVTTPKPEVARQKIPEIFGWTASSPTTTSKGQSGE